MTPEMPISSKSQEIRPVFFEPLVHVIFIPRDMLEIGMSLNRFTLKLFFGNIVTK